MHYLFTFLSLPCLSILPPELFCVFLGSNSVKLNWDYLWSLATHSQLDWLLIIWLLMATGSTRANLAVLQWQGWIRIQVTESIALAFSLCNSIFTFSPAVFSKTHYLLSVSSIKNVFSQIVLHPAFLLLSLTFVLLISHLLYTNHPYCFVHRSTSKTCHLSNLRFSHYCICRSCIKVCLSSVSLFPSL